MVKITFLETGVQYDEAEIRKKDLAYIKMQHIIFNSIKDGKGNWGEISAAVKAAGIEPKNWLTEVRIPLQGLRDAKLVDRVNDVHKEEYVLV